MRRGSVLKVATIGLVGLFGVTAATVGGYKAVTGRCLLTGACDSKVQVQATVTPVAATTGQDEACPMGCSESKDAHVETVALATETECHEKAATCADKAASCTEGEKLAGACGDECPPEGCDKPDCCKKVAQGESTEKVGG
jgi:hypothetical protein